MEENKKAHAQLIVAGLEEPTSSEELVRAEFGWGGCHGCLIEALAQAMVADASLMTVVAEALKAASLRRLQMRNGVDLQGSVNLPHRQN